MDEELKVALREIGLMLDRNMVLDVKNGGVVVPSTPTVTQPNSGVEFKDVSAPNGRQEAEPGQGGPGTWPHTGARTPGGSGTAGQAAPLLVASLRRQYEEEIRELQLSYPGTQHWLTENDIWLIVESSPLRRLTVKTYFAVAISFGAAPFVRAWGFRGTAVGFEWIGPRHTNFPDGSICAYDPSDGTWNLGNPLVELLDLYSIWAIRQLHLKIFGKWPGYQSAPQIYERILELNPDEFCGCVEYNRLYKHCCMARDRASDIVQEAVRFMFWSGGGIRRPPSSVVKFMQDRRVAPDPINLWGSPRTF